ncbi:MAG TPA: hypothetical protein VNL69_01350 [Bacteroidota bacterium]|nr:hypothetical protein [Bacteroidota bacterium]
MSHVAQKRVRTIEVLQNSVEGYLRSGRARNTATLALHALGALSDSFDDILERM